MRIQVTLLVVFILSSCSNGHSFENIDLEQINQIRTDYINGWLAGDSETVLKLFKSDATITPDGMEPISGIDKIENYWFPNDSSETIIHSYEVELLNLQGTDSMAYSLEKGILNFTYSKGNFNMTKESTSFATTVYQKGSDGVWKISSRMWTTSK